MRTANRRLLGGMTGLFVAIHAAYFMLGVRFDERPLGSFWQYLDPDLLSSDLLRSLFYLHAQPPLFNLFLGLVLKSFPNQHVLVFEALFLACGWALCLALLVLMRRLDVSNWLALALTTAFVASPAFVLQEQWLFYAFPVACFVALAALALEDFLRTGRLRSAGAFWGLLLLLGGTWSLFHLAYLALVALGLGALLPARRATLLRAAALPAALLLALYAKNAVVFGHFAPSTWLGMNLARITIRGLPAEQLERLRAEGALSSVALVHPFARLERYPPGFRGQGLEGFAGVPCLSRPLKADNEENLNHIAYVGISEQYLRDSLVVLRRAPQAYLSRLSRAWLDYLSPASHAQFLQPNSERAWPFMRLYDVLAYRRERALGRSSKAACLDLGLLFGLPAAFAFGVWSAWRARAAPERALMLFLCFTIAWVALVGNSLEVGENSRFRFATDPLSLALLGLSLERAVTKVRGAGRGLAGLTPSSHAA